MAALLTFNWQPMQAQSCIDFEVIDEILGGLPDACDCNDPIQLGETGQVKYITEYQLNGNRYIEAKSLDLYPNPSGGNFHLRFDKPLELDAPLQVFDLSGKLVHRTSVPVRTEQFTLNLGHLRSGKYLIRIELNGEIHTSTGIISK